MPLGPEGKKLIKKKKEKEKKKKKKGFHRIIDRDLNIFGCKTAILPFVIVK